MQKKSLNIAILVTILLCALYFPTAETAVSAEQADMKIIIGEWVRPDGGYTVLVRDVNPDGSVDVGYFNPNKINISEANVSMWKGLVKLFIKLQDKGYPGSTYTLYYYAEKDALAGFYYQAVMGQTFEVVFLRK
ncbi:MAG: hypothetical protein JSV60_05680, partial [Desulfobacterales bacterium]